MPSIVRRSFALWSTPLSALQAGTGAVFKPTNFRGEARWNHRRWGPPAGR